MDIKLCSNKLKRFDEIRMGGTFMYLGNVFIKTDERLDINAVSLHAGCLAYLDSNETVTEIRGSFVEEGAEYGY